MKYKYREGLACATCMGLGSNDGVGAAFSVGTVVLMAFTFLMVAGIVAAVRYIEQTRHETDKLV